MSDMWTTMESPVGELRIVANDHAITAIEFDTTLRDATSPRSSAARAANASAGRPRGDRDDGNALLAEAFAHTYWWAVALTLAAFVPAAILAAAERRARREQAAKDARGEGDTAAPHIPAAA